MRRLSLAEIKKPGNGEAAGQEGVRNEELRRYDAPVFLSAQSVNLARHAQAKRFQFLIGSPNSVDVVIHGCERVVCWHFDAFAGLYHCFAVVVIRC
jgi:hypothetical protein